MEWGKIPAAITFCGQQIFILNMVHEVLQRAIPYHSHGMGSYEIHYVPTGYGRASIDGKTYDITPNTLYVTGPHIRHAQVSDPAQPMMEYCLYLKLESKHAMQNNTEKDVISIFADTPFWFCRGQTHIGDLIVQLFHEASTRELGYEIQMELLLKQILVCFARLYGDNSNTSHRQFLTVSADKTPIVIEEYFLYHYRELSLDGLSQQLGLSLRQTERTLKKYYGKTFLEKKSEARMSTASMLLTNTSLRISDIAEELGYSCVEHFSAAFRAYYHASPRQYRNAHFLGETLDLP